MRSLPANERRPTPEALWGIPADWALALGGELFAPSLLELAAFVAEQRATHQVFPPEDSVFSALELTSFQKTRVVILGQDPYHGPGQAHGLAFSVRPGVPPPPSLANIFKELQADLGIAPRGHGSLAGWAKQGVLLLNTVLTVRAHAPLSHRNRGWERFTDAVVRALAERPIPPVFVLWGKAAQAKAGILRAEGTPMVTGAHPSPLSAHNGFFGSRPFSAVNRLLEQRPGEPIQWAL